MKVLTVVSSGLLTTVQDLGRRQARHLGVPQSGSLDDFSHRLANWLVGNSEEAAVLEMTITGGEFLVLAEMAIALTGAEMGLRLNGKVQPQWALVQVKKGDHIQVGTAVRGCRSYLAMTGGIDVPPVLGSRSTCLGARMGGLQGRALRKGDVLDRLPGGSQTISRQLSFTPRWPRQSFLRVLAGPHDDCFTGQLTNFFSQIFTVSEKSNRIGCRLLGAPVKRDPDARESILSEPVVPGNIQIPADGNPIILLKEQTIGGYTSIATVLSIDLFKAAQLMPGDTVRFLPISLMEASSLTAQWRQYLEEIQENLERQQ